MSFSIITLSAKVLTHMARQSLRKAAQGGQAVKRTTVSIVSINNHYQCLYCSLVTLPAMLNTVNVYLHVMLSLYQIPGVLMQFI